MSSHALRVGMTGSKHALPPLRSTKHIRIVKGHLGIHPFYTPSLFPQSETQVGFFSRDHRIIEPADGREGFRPHERIPSAGVRLTDRRIPFHVTQKIVDRSPGVSFSTTSADDGHPRFRHCAHSQLEPSGVQLTVAIDKLHELQFRT
jgi:hypothetical protein